jgi:hypothetical protein
MADFSFFLCFVSFYLLELEASILVGSTISYSPLVSVILFQQKLTAIGGHFKTPHIQLD